VGGLDVTHTFNTPGFHTVRLRVTDNEGADDTEVKTVTVSAPANTPPTADFDFTPAEPLVGDSVQFSSSSADGDGDIITHEWDLDGDGDFDDGLGSEVTRAYTAAGTYDVGLRVTDDDTATDSETKELVVRAPQTSPAGSQQSTPAQATCGGIAATVVGTAADDRLLGTSGDDVIAALQGDDRGNRGDDVLGGGLGDDSVFGGGGTDDCDGGLGDDRLRSCP
jgi:PKD repeat protein